MANLADKESIVYWTRDGSRAFTTRGGKITLTFLKT